MLWLRRRGNRACLLTTELGWGDLDSGPFPGLIRSDDRPHRPFTVRIHMWWSNARVSGILPELAGSTLSSTLLVGGRQPNTVPGSHRLLRLLQL